MGTGYSNITAFLEDLSLDPPLQQMKLYPHHGQVSTYDHCMHVAMFSYELVRRLRLDINLDTLLTGAMLHDFYLYDWHARDGGTHRLHGLRHPYTAAVNARRYYAVSDDVAHVIESHMWPLTLTRIPKTAEAWIVCTADKWVSVRETLLGR